MAAFVCVCVRAHPQRRKKSGTSVRCSCTGASKISSPVRHRPIAQPRHARSTGSGWQGRFRGDALVLTRALDVRYRQGLHGAAAHGVGAGRQAHPAGDVAGESVPVFLWMVCRSSNVSDDGLTESTGVRSGDVSSVGLGSVDMLSMFYCIRFQGRTVTLSSYPLMYNRFQLHRRRKGLVKLKR